MDEPITWRALEALAALLSTVLVANGYRTDMGANVTLEPYQQQQDSGPRLVIVAGTIETVQEKSTPRRTQSEMPITFEYQLPADFEDAQLQAHRGRADLKQALTSASAALPKGCSAFRIESATVIQPEQGAKEVVAQVTARAVLEEINPSA